MHLQKHSKQVKRGKPSIMKKGVREINQWHVPSCNQQTDFTTNHNRDFHLQKKNKSHSCPGSNITSWSFQAPPPNVYKGALRVACVSIWGSLTSHQLYKQSWALLIMVQDALKDCRWYCTCLVTKLFFLSGCSVLCALKWDFFAEKMRGEGGMSFLWRAGSSLLMRPPPWGLSMHPQQLSLMPGLWALMPLDLSLWGLSPQLGDKRITSGVPQTWGFPSTSHCGNHCEPQGRNLPLFLCLSPPATLLLNSISWSLTRKEKAGEHNLWSLLDAFWVGS